jgi:hypothetical protein
MICLGASSSAWAQSAWVYVGDGNGYGPLCTQNPGFQFLTVVLGSAAGPVKTARFKIVASSPVTIVNAPDGEFDLTLSQCVQYGPLTQLLVFVPPGPSVTLSIVPATGHTAIELNDCDGYAMPTVSSCGYYQIAAPYRPNPPDGATDVPTNQLLSYVGDANFVALSTNPNMDIWDPANVILCNNIETGTTGPACSLPLNPGLLAPHTTYYWKAANYCACGQVEPGNSERFSFTTGDGPVAVEATTWGRVKAAYRK